MAEVKLNSQLLRELIKLSTPKTSNFPASMPDLAKRFGVSCQFKHVYNGYRFLKPVMFGEWAGGHNYPLNTPVLPILSNRHGSTYRTVYMMCVFVDAGKLTIGNWSPSYTENFRVISQISLADFMKTLPPDGPLAVVRNTGYPGSSESDIIEFNDVVGAVAGRMGAARG